MEGFESVEKIGEGDTNDVYETSKGSILKHFSKYSVPAHFFSLFNFLMGEFQVYTPKVRKRNEIRLRAILNSYNLSAPKIIETGDTWIEMEKVKPEGVLIDLLAEEYKNSQELGKKIGTFLSEMHSKGIVFRDFNLENLILDEDLYLIDQEYINENGNFLEKKMEIVNFLSTVKLIKPSNYEEFIEGFQHGYGEIGRKTNIASDLWPPMLLYTLLTGETSSKLSNLKKNF